MLTELFDKETQKTVITSDPMISPRSRLFPPLRRYGEKRPRLVITVIDEENEVGEEEEYSEESTTSSETETESLSESEEENVGEKKIAKLMSICLSREKIDPPEEFTSIFAFDWMDDNTMAHHDEVFGYTEFGDVYSDIDAIDELVI